MARKTEGATANKQGKRLERFIQSHLEERHYQFVDKINFLPAMYIEQPIYSRQVYIGQTIYETARYCDFILYHPQKWPDALVIEAKWQQASGSIDEKYPYTILNIKRLNYQTIFLLDGGGYKKGAENWIISQIDSKLLQVFNMTQFQTWVDRGNI